MAEWLEWAVKKPRGHVYYRSSPAACLAVNGKRGTLFQVGFVWLPVLAVLVIKSPASSH